MLQLDRFSNIDYLETQCKHLLCKLVSLDLKIKFIIYFEVHKPNFLSMGREAKSKDNGPPFLVLRRSSVFTGGFMEGVRGSE